MTETDLSSLSSPFFESEEMPASYRLASAYQDIHELRTELYQARENIIQLTEGLTLALSFINKKNGEKNDIT